MKKVMKVCIWTLVILGVGYACYCSIKTGIKRQNIVDCYHSQRICLGWYDVHKGKCFECEEMERCEKESVFNEE